MNFWPGFHEILIHNLSRQVINAAVGMSERHVAQNKHVYTILLIVTDGKE